jgi:hypothetical protein
VSVLGQRLRIGPIAFLPDVGERIDVGHEVVVGDSPAALTAFEEPRSVDLGDKGALKRRGRTAVTAVAVRNAQAGHAAHIGIEAHSGKRTPSQARPVLNLLSGTERAHPVLS